MAQNLKPDETYYLNGVRVNEYLLNEHNENDIALPDTDIEELIGVTIHNTNDLQGIYDSAMQYTAATLDGDMKDVRVHYYVDDLGAWQNLPLNSTGWHSTDGEGDGNTKTIAIETIMDSSTAPEDVKARDNAARLAAYLLYSNGLDENNLYTHTHWLNVSDGIEGSTDYLNTLQNPYKYCPEFILPDWFGFKALVGSYIDQLESSNSNNPFRPYFAEITTGTLNVRSGPGADFPVTSYVFGGEVYKIISTIAGDSADWGELDNGAGWINLEYTTRV